MISDIIKYQKSGTAKGITSICSSNKFVLETAMLNAKNYGHSLLIESTSNQVDQFGGYSGMTPKMFRNYVWQIADDFEYPKEKIILGGDHLGPNVWQSESVESAMQKAEDQIRAYVKAGFKKIHIDTSFPLGNEKNNKLSTKVKTKRAARLCEVAEDTQKKSSNKISKPFYVIGTDVPVPGGAIDETDNLEVTPVEELQETISMTKSEFLKRGLNDAWKRVIAVVVQPGVEFTDTKVFEYDRKKTADLKSIIEKDEKIVLEAHSTDYQTKESLRQMVEDHFGILKVGPWLTFAFRESVFALEVIEKELFSLKKGITTSQLSKIVIEEMNNNPKYWKNHYKGSNGEIYFAQIYSFSDRIRYYWNTNRIKNSIDILINNLSKSPIPLSILSQYLPKQYSSVRDGKIKNHPISLIRDKISEVLKIYNFATSGV